MALRKGGVPGAPGGVQAAQQVAAAAVAGGSSLMVCPTARF